MIRFCNREVCCVYEEEMDRQQIIKYFLDGHREETVCVLDKEGKFAGSIRYSMILGRELSEAISREHIVLGETTWEEGRRCFERCAVAFGGPAMIPVADKDGNLVCFAYQDDEANRELRMLHELMEQENALGFRDVYPQYEHVTVHGCNELAYQYVMYLKKEGIPVNVTGDIWESLRNNSIVGEAEECGAVDYKDYVIYAEGTKQKEENMKLRQSVSAEFECVDKIYEKNIAEGVICDAAWSLEEVLSIFREKPVGILMQGNAFLYAYDLLLSYKIDVCCFVTENINAEKRMICGKPALVRQEAQARWRDIIFIDSNAKNSAWGFGQTDRYSYFGFKRNQRFFLLRDYIEIPSDSFMNIINHRMQKPEGRIVLAGDIRLCLRMQQILGLRPEYCGRVVYCDILEKDTYQIDGMIPISVNQIEKEDVCLLLLPKYYGCVIDCAGTKMPYHQYLLDAYKSRLKKYEIVRMINYAFENMKFLDSMEQSDHEKMELVPDKILLAEINSFSGNEFLNQILEDHPNIIMLPNGSYLRSNLYSLCIRLEMEPGDKILETFWKLYKEESQYYNDEDEEGIFTEIDLFNKSMAELLEKRDRFTSWELFVIIHIAFAEMQGRMINDVSKMILYWEPHYADPRERYAEWLDKIGSQGFIINMVRNAYLRAGSALDKLYVLDNEAVRKTEQVLKFPNGDKKQYKNWTRIVLKFENMKLDFEKEWKMFCSRTGIDCPDNFQGRFLNERNPIFSLASVYRTWEEHFSAFDYFRICLITGPWQKEYGYPYTESLAYSRSELETIFSKKFRFENNWVFENKESELKYWNWRQKIIGELLWSIRRKEILGESADKVEQHEIQDCSIKRI